VQQLQTVVRSLSRRPQSNVQMAAGSVSRWLPVCSVQMAAGLSPRLPVRFVQMAPGLYTRSHNRYRRYLLVSELERCLIMPDSLEMFTAMFPEQLKAGSTARPDASCADAGMPKTPASNQRCPLRLNRTATTDSQAPSASHGDSSTRSEYCSSARRRRGTTSATSSRSSRPCPIPGPDDRAQFCEPRRMADHAASLVALRRVIGKRTGPSALTNRGRPTGEDWHVSRKRQPWRLWRRDDHRHRLDVRGEVHERDT
jgi:hypothetical protein